MLSSDAVLERAAELKARGVPFVLATVVRCDSPTSANLVPKALSTPTARFQAGSAAVARNRRVSLR